MNRRAMKKVRRQHKIDAKPMRRPKCALCLQRLHITEMHIPWAFGVAYAHPHCAQADAEQWKERILQTVMMVRYQAHPVYRKNIPTQPPNLVDYYLATADQRRSYAAFQAVSGGLRRDRGLTYYQQVAAAYAAFLAGVSNDS